MSTFAIFTPHRAKHLLTRQPIAYFTHISIKIHRSARYANCFRRNPPVCYKNCSPNSSQLFQIASKLPIHHSEQDHARSITHINTTWCNLSPMIRLDNSFLNSRISSAKPTSIFTQIYHRKQNGSYIFVPRFINDLELRALKNIRHACLRDRAALYAVSF